MLKYFSLTPAQTLAKLESSQEEGLSDAQIQQRRQEYGFNELPEKKRSLVLLFLKQFQDIMVYILLVALGLSIITPFYEGHAITWNSFLDAYAILAILLMNAVLGFVQEYKAEEAIAQLKKLSAPHARVRRDGTEHMIPSRELLPGDIVIVEAGDSIAADGRLLEESFLEVNESSLTGESLPSSKFIKPIKHAVSLGDRDNMVFSGTLVTSGSAEFVVTAIGIHTQIGKIAHLVSQTEVPQTPLARRMNSLGKILGGIVLGLCTIIFVVGWLNGISLTHMLLIGISLAVSAVPEGLPAVITVCLAIGVRRMVKKHVLVRRMESLETLGSVTVICSDKTGTITENRMTVVEHWIPMPHSSTKGKKEEELLIQIGASCNRAELPDLGDPTEIGLLEYAKNNDVERLDIDEEEVPFTSEKKYMQTRHGKRSYLKGAPEVIINLCDDVDDDEVCKHNDRLAKQGLRVLGCAVIEGKKMRFVGLLGMEDPPRKTVKKAIVEAEQAGIRTIMITGDNVTTAQAIAAKVGIQVDAMIGHDIDQLTEKQLQKKLQTVSVFARVSPEHKLQILDALKKQGAIVAMSGDGVNDAPALKGAHVGIAMGQNGTEVARQAASMVLADDHFSSIVNAIREGRRIYDNIRKFVVFLLRTNFYELLLIIVAILLGMELPYLPVHILLINLFTDGLPALALAMEKAEPDIMRRPPRDKNEHILDGEWSRLIFTAFLGFLASFLLYVYQLKILGTSLELARTMTVTFALVFELFAAFSMRSERPLWEIGVFSNKWLIYAALFPITIQLTLLYTPLNTAFSFIPLNLQQWGLVIGIGAIMFAIFEGTKLLSKR